MKTLAISLRLVLWTTLVLGVGYPLVVTGLAQVLFPSQANGSIVTDDSGKPVGSLLIGQDFSSKTNDFVGRPSAAGDHAYNPLGSAGSNLTVVGKAFQDGVSKLRDSWAAKAAAVGVTSPVPEALVTASASGLDPDLDAKAALWEVPIVAKARNADAGRIADLVRSQTVNPLLPWDPPPFVNVLKLNLALNKAFP
jgi:K+-transporting ATPase ATPase C chain